MKQFLNRLFGSLRENVKDTSRKKFLKGFGYLISQDYEKALDELKEVVKENSDKVEMYIALGTLYRNKGEYLKAIHIHEAAVGDEKLGNDIKKQVLHELVLDYKCIGQYDKAIYYLKNLMQIDKSTTLHKLMGNLLFEKMEYMEAIKYFQKYAKLSKKDVGKEIAYSYFKLAEENSELKGKIKFLKKSLTYFPEFRLANYELVNVLKDKKLFEQLNFIISHDVFFEYKDINMVAGIFFDAGKMDTFVKKCITKVASKNQNPFYYIFLSDHFNKQGNTEKGKEILKDYIINFKKVLAVYEYMNLENDDFLKSVIDKKPYICDSCKVEFNEFFDICPHCKSIQSFSFN